MSPNWQSSFLSPLFWFTYLWFLTPQKGRVSQTLPDEIIPFIRNIYSAHILSFAICHIPSPLCDKQSAAAPATMKLF